MTTYPPPGGWRQRVRRAGGAVLRASLKISPRLMAWVIRQQFARNGAQIAASLRAAAPSGVTAVKDERYDDGEDALLDVYTPATATAPGTSLPTVVWIHGGGFVGGSKGELDGYFRMLAAAGFTVVGVDYSLAPAARYPTPVRQVMAALRHIQTEADRLHVDPTRLIVAGDSAGAHIAAQVAALVTNPSYGEQVGVAPTISADQLVGAVLCCGVYDLRLVTPNSPLASFVLTFGWSYSGVRAYSDDEYFASTTAVPRHVTAAFPPTFVTVGNADPLLAQSRVLVAALEAVGVDVDTLLYADDHHPPLGHEYQFDLTLEDGRTALHRLIAFLRRTTGPSGRDRAGVTPAALGWR
jgi:acetyl esterase/lipase